MLHVALRLDSRVAVHQRLPVERRVDHVDALVERRTPLEAVHVEHGQVDDRVASRLVGDPPVDRGRVLSGVDQLAPLWHGDRGDERLAEGDHADCGQRRGLRLEPRQRHRREHRQRERQEDARPARHADRLEQRDRVAQESPGPRPEVVAESADPRAEGHERSRQEQHGEGDGFPARPFPAPAHRDRAGQHQAGHHQAWEQVVRPDGAEQVRDLPVDAVPRARREERLDRRRVQDRLLCAPRVALGGEGSLVHPVDGEECEAGQDGCQGAGLQSVPATPEQHQQKRRQHRGRDHPVIAAGQEREDEEERGEERVLRSARLREPDREQQNERPPLRAERREVGHLVGADRREGEESAGEERDPLPRPQLPRQPVSRQRR